ncbi:hypothetical protein HK405_009741, partial [Cladochytrium tenue]
MKRVSRRISQSAFDLQSPPPPPQDSDEVGRPAPPPVRQPRPLSQVSALEEWGEEDGFSLDPPSDPRHFSFASTASVKHATVGAPSFSKASGVEAASAKPRPSDHAPPHSSALLPARTGGAANNGAVPSSSGLRAGHFVPPGTIGLKDGPFIPGRLSSSATPV